MIPQNPPLIQHVFILGFALAAAAVFWLLLHTGHGRPGRWRLPTSRSAVWDWLAVGLLIAYTAIFAGLSLRAQAAMQTTWDLALYSNALWNTLHGRFLYSGMLNDATNYFGTHFTPIMLLFLPLVAVWDGPETLLVLQTLLLAAGGLPVYWLATRYLGHKGWGLIFLLAYLLHPGLQYTNLDMFHGMALLAPLLTWAIFFLLTGRTRLFLVCVALMWATREDAPLLTLMLGLYIWLVQKRSRLGLGLAALSMAWGLLVVEVIVPAFRTPGDYLHATALYSYLGESPGEMLVTLITRPGLVLQQVFQPQKLSFVAHLWVPLGLLSWLAPELVALSLPSLFILLLSDFWVQTSIEYHYAAPLLPFAVVGAIVGLKPVAYRLKPAARRLLPVYLLATALASYALLGPGPLGGRFDPARFRPDERTPLMTDAIAQVGPDDALLVNRRFYPQVSRRQHLFSFPDPRADLPVDAILLDTLGPETTPPSFPHVLASPDASSFPRFDLAWERDQVKVWRPNGQYPLDRPVGARFAGETRFELLRWGRLPGEATSLRPGDTLQVALSWRGEGQPDRRYAFFVHLVEEGDGWLNLWAQADQEPAGGLHPTTLWRKDQLFADSYRLELPPDLPPGNYELVAGVFAVDEGQRLMRSDAAGNVARLGQVRVEPALVAGNPDSLGLSRRLDLPVAPGLTLLGIKPPRSELRPGDLLELRMYWQAGAAIEADYHWRFSLAAAGEEPPAPDSPLAVSSWQVAPARGRIPSSAWRPGILLRDWLHLRLPADAPAGQYTLWLQILDAAGEVAGEPVALAQVTVKGRPRLFEQPAMEHIQPADFAGQIALLGYDMPQTVLQPGAILPLTLYWQALKTPDASYTVFVHLLDASEHIWAQQDRIPAGDQPTSGWLSGEVVVDSYELDLKAGTPPGIYRLEVGLYDAISGQRLPLTTGGDRVLLETTIEVEGE